MIGESGVSHFITEAQHRALLKAMEMVFERCGGVVSLRLLQRKVRSKWKVTDERQLLQTDYMAVLQYLRRWLECGGDPDELRSGKLKLIRQVHVRREQLGWEVHRLRTVIKERFNVSRLLALREEQLVQLLALMEAADKVNRRIGESENQ